jgi:Spy/CpxP family protein refolding chaperone
MKKYAVPVLLSALVLIGVSACNPASQSTTAPQSDPAPAQTTTTDTQSQDNSQAKAYQTAERTRRREALRKQIEAVLTPDQAKQLDAKLQQGEKIRQALSELNLTDAQKTQIKEAMKAARANSQDNTPKSSP